MANEAPRDRATTPSFPGIAEGGFEVWIRVLQNQIRIKLRFHLISGIPTATRPAEERDEERVAAIAAVQAIAHGHIAVPYDGDTKSERRLASISPLGLD
jgi:hypothetical protein